MKKLTLSKEVVSKLDNNQMGNIKGGTIVYTIGPECNNTVQGPTMYPGCSGVPTCTPTPFTKACK